MVTEADYDEIAYNDGDDTNNAQSYWSWSWSMIINHNDNDHAHCSPSILLEDGRMTWSYEPALLLQHQGSSYK